MMGPAVSVIVPTCGRPELLRLALQSVLAQTFSDFELIVVDDMPAASSVGVVSLFQDSRLNYIVHDGQKGAPAARNTGLASARADLITFLDDDDEWFPDYLFRMMDAMADLSLNTGVLHCACEYVSLEGKKVGQSVPRYKGWVYPNILRGEKSGGITALVRRKVFECCGKFDEKLVSAQDWDMWLRASREFEFAFIPDVLVRIRVTGDRISSDPQRAILARERILEKYAVEFSVDLEARAIHQKRLGKLFALSGEWKSAWHWFFAAARGRFWEWFRIGGWLLFEYPELWWNRAKEA